MSTLNNLNTHRDFHIYCARYILKYTLYSKTSPNQNAYFRLIVTAISFYFIHTTLMSDISSNFETLMVQKKIFMECREFHKMITDELIHPFFIYKALG